MEGKPHYIFGIDAGTKTGLAIWDTKAKCFVEIKTVKIHTAFEIVSFYKEKGIKVVVEDARQVRYGTDKNKAQGAGSIKRDAKIWQDFLTDKGIPFEMRRPNKAITKWDAERFKRQTGWQGSTDTHRRDAALLVYQY